MMASVEKKRDTGDVLLLERRFVEAQNRAILREFDHARGIGAGPEYERTTKKSL